MPFASVNNTRLFYRLEGTEGRRALVCGTHPALTWGCGRPQMADFLAHFQVLRYDILGVCCCWI